MVPAGGSHQTVDAWLVRGDRGATLVLANFAPPRGNGAGVLDAQVCAVRDGSLDPKNRCPPCRHEMPLGAKRAT